MKHLKQLHTLGQAWSAPKTVSNQNFLMYTQWRGKAKYFRRANPTQEGATTAYEVGKQHQFTIPKWKWLKLGTHIPLLTSKECVNHIIAHLTKRVCEATDSCLLCDREIKSPPGKVEGACHRQMGVRKSKRALNPLCKPTSIGKLSKPTYVPTSKPKASWYRRRWVSY